ncbi:MAG TPA: HAMP domain-containing sensor histidine kinase [Acidimicrobiia bacterium]|nr:HAMP domain-containing sensor histidine kinase [Acidimicrobiia bacterium]
MRRRLALWSLAITTLVVISLTVPLALLVQRQAAERAQVEAELSAQSTASLIALASALGDEADPAAIADGVGPLPARQVVILPDGTILGDPGDSQRLLTEEVGNTATAAADYVKDGWELAVPVVTRDGTVVVSAFVTDEELTEGVTQAWLLLGLLGILIVTAAATVADRLAKRLVEPLENLAETATRLGEGDLTARVELSPPPEIEELGRSFNWLADRLNQLLAEEREAVADLSHRLRTPLTSLRLQAERVADPDERVALVAQVGRLEQAIDQLIEEARKDQYRAPGKCDLGVVVGARAAFWSVLAEEQDREFEIVIDAGSYEVGLTEDAVAAVVDTLIENVFSHTPEGTSFGVRVLADRGPTLEVFDHGPGFRSAAAIGRGVSGAGSTGLGLDIARRAAGLSGGGLELSDRPGGGAVVRVWFG